MREIRQMLGLVLCGGKSSRMGRDKSRLKVRFHGQAVPLEARVRQSSILKEFCSKVYFSCNQEQVAGFEASGEFGKLGSGVLVCDDPFLIGKGVGGPALGLLSAHLKFPTESILVLACDLLCVGSREVAQLFEVGKGELASAAAFCQPAEQPEEEDGKVRIEPLLSWWSSQLLSEFLKETLSPVPPAVEGQASMMKFLLRQVSLGKCLPLKASEPSVLVSMNTPDSIWQSRLEFLE